MKKLWKILAGIISLTIIGFIAFYGFILYESGYFSNRTVAAPETALWVRLKQKAQEAESFISDNQMEESFCLLVDFSLPFKEDRIFVWDFDRDTIESSSLCCHGWAKGKNGIDRPFFSNEEGSHASSLGKYKVGKRGYSNWGIHVNYKLHGLEATNSNAYDRFIVLHSFHLVHPRYSQGCPIVSDDYMRYLDEKLKPVTKPVLFWIYND